MKLPLSLVTVLLIGCGPTGFSGDPTSSRFLALDTDKPKRDINSTIEPMIAEYIQASEDAGLSTVYSVDELQVFDFAQGLLQGHVPAIGGGTITEEAQLLGVCEIAYERNDINKKIIFQVQLVYFDSSQNSVIGSYAFKAVVWHELSHCLFGVGHNLTDQDSIMYPYLSQDEVYWRTNWDARQTALFDWIQGEIEK